MRIYYVYSFQDENINGFIKKFEDGLLSEKYRPFYFLSEESGNSFWKPKARKKIKQSDLVIFFLGELYSGNSKNIDFELETAKKYGKEVICVPMNDSVEKKIVLDKYNRKHYAEYKCMKIDDLKNNIIENLYNYNLDPLLFQGRNIDEFDEVDKYNLLEQYREMISSSESLMDRRQNTSSFHISINTAFIGMLGVFGALGLNRELFCLMLMVISIFGVIVSTSWIGALNSYNRINSSKYDVLEAMERHLPASMFHAEYKDSKNYMRSRTYPSYSQRELVIPQSFRVLYAVMFVASIVFLTYCILDHFAIF